MGSGKSMYFVLAGTSEVFSLPDLMGIDDCNQ